jgi:hypothetical protein
VQQREAAAATGAPIASNQSAISPQTAQRELCRSTREEFSSLPTAFPNSASEEDAASGECRERVARQAMPLSSAFAKVEEVLRKRDEDYEGSLPKSRDLTAYTHHDRKMILMSGTMQNILRSIPI